MRVLANNRSLLYSLIRREIVGRYRGSIMGILWSLFNPLLMLVVYTFVFSVVFKARWIGGSDSKTEFALVLFSGLMVYSLFSECVIRAPSLIIGNVNYVKKVIFPLELLPVVALGSAIFHFSISLLVWIVFFVTFFGAPKAEILLLPLVVLPLMIATLGVSWLLASLGVYLRDVTQIVGVVTTVLMFLSPIFYPIAALPEAYQPFMQFSPLTFVVEQTRDVMIWGNGIKWLDWSIRMFISIIVFWLGLAWFQKTRKGFADVL
ncbi:ABC transporter permease [Stutzerimonas stutzeri]|uniref:ABC transporter permease n=1 Tax=Stutzerimonas stutzeri TaxID=316 RepID=UPI0024481A12|nr:ABC transporter permease [Stutzerimonas stutzeri]MDH0101605.1 ABC transporter permease [Stutzerimonas stutzeri]